MAERILMIALSPTMEEGKIISWKVKMGDEVKSGAVLCEVETDKATMEYEAPKGGTILKILRKEGEQVRVGEPIAWLGKADEKLPADVEEQASQPKPSQVRPPQPKEGPPVSRGSAGDQKTSPIIAAPKEGPRLEIPSTGEGRGNRSSPLARRLASERGIDLRWVSGSGPGGRIVKRDILQYQEQGEGKRVRISTVPGMEDTEIPVTGMRAAIAKRLSESFFTAPHYFLRVAVQMDALLDARSRINAESGQKLSLNAFFIKLAAEALRKHPRINSSWKGSTIKLHGSIDIGLAVALQDGLITPVVRNCAQKGIRELDQELSALIEKAKAGSLTPEEYSDATFTISNLGSFGIEEFTAIINPPGSAILALGEIRKEPVVTDTDEVVIRKMMRLTVSCDHRTIDGAVGASFLRDLRGMIEDPFRALL